MSLEAIYYVGQTIAVVMIFASLLFVGIQVRQANRATQLAAIDAIRQERRQVFLAGRDSPYIPGILDRLYNGENLTGEQALRWQLHLSTMWGLAYSEWLQTQTRATTGYESKGAIDLVVRLPHSLDWFASNAGGIYPAGFCEHIEQRKSEMDTSNNPEPFHKKIVSAQLD